MNIKHSTCFVQKMLPRTLSLPKGLKGKKNISKSPLDITWHTKKGREEPAL
jgi:hypothetical protein